MRLCKLGRQVVAHASVTRNTHLGKIESLHFNICLDPESNHNIDQLEDDERQSRVDDEVCCHANAFCKELRSISVEQTCYHSGNTV